MSNIDDLIAQAKNAGQAITPLTPINPPAAPAVASGGLPTAFNMDTNAFLNPGGMEVDSYVQVKEGGIKLNKDWDGFIEEFEAIIDLSEVQFFMGIRKEVGSNVTYAKTYDGVTTPRGENFAQVVAEFKRDSQKPADVYRGADIPMKLVNDYADPRSKGTKVQSAGDIVGLSTSITGFKPWASFHRKLANGGLGNATVRVKVMHSPRKNSNNQAYGVCEFELLEVVDNG